MASELKVTTISEKDSGTGVTIDGTQLKDTKVFTDQVDPKTGTALTLGTSGDTVTVPSGVGLTLTDSTLLLPTTIQTDKLDPKSGTALEIGTSGDTITVPTGAGLTVTDEVKTNKISPATGTAFTLGDSGDTFTVPSGATLDNLGTATGFATVAWQSVVTGSTLSAAAFKGYPIDTTSNACTVTLPAGTVGDIVALIDYAGTWDTNNVTLTTTEKIQGLDTDALLSTEREGVSLVYVDATQGWLVDTSNDGGLTHPSYITATGGTVTTDGNYKVHTFTGNGTFEVTALGNAAGSTTVDYLIVAGAGGGGKHQAGGGGAGGMRYSYPNPDTGGHPVTATTYPVVIGGGGAGQTTTTCNGQGADGVDSSVFSVTSTGGGGGGGYSNPGLPGGAGRDGGSGGGAGSASTTGGTPQLTPPATRGAGNNPPVSPAQGTNGGRAWDRSSHGGGGGGGHDPGGGKSAPAPGTGGQGGCGTSLSIPGSATVYAGGGGSSSYQGCSTAPPNGGGGGDGGHAAGTPAEADGVAGTANTGGGGGGSANSTYDGGTGGSGVVVVRYRFQ